MADMLKMALVVALITGAVILIIRLAGSGAAAPAPDAFCEGVYVNGISLGGMTYEEGASAVMNGLDQRLNQDSYTLVYGSETWTFAPSEFDAELKSDVSEQLALAWNLGHTGTAKEQREQAELLKNNPIHYDSEIEYNEALLEEFLLGVKAKVDIAPVEATVMVGANERLTVTRSQNGQVLSIEELRRTLDAAIRDGNATTIELTPTVKEPNYTTEALLENTQLIAEWSTNTGTSSSNRVKNIRRALEKFNGTTLVPGDTMSFNQIVGKRTEANGFFEADEYDGTSVVKGIGGGACQASTTLYVALLKANIDIVQRSTHTMTVFYAQPSMDAAVSASKDLKFTNNLAYPIYIYTHVDTQSARVRIYGPPSGYRIEIEPEILEERPPQKNKIVVDESGKHATYTDEHVFKSEGKNMVRSRAFRVYYDPVSGAEVRRQELETDTYREKQPEYWRGTQVR